MRKLFFLILVALLVGAGVIAVIETDPGYVLLAYGDYTVETSVWVGLVLLLVLTLIIYWTLRLLRRLMGSQDSLNSWLGGRRSRVAARLTTRGLINYIEGNWERARKQLLRGADNSDAPMINYLMAARSSHHLNEPDKMREYLGAAEASESQAGIAVELTQAELKLESGQYEQACANLVRARRDAGRHPHVLDLLHRAYYGLKDWSELIALLPDLRKYQVLPADTLDALEREVHVKQLAASASGGEEGAEKLRQAWKNMPTRLRQDSSVLQEYVGLLVAGGHDAAAEKVILRALKQSWDSVLVREYGLIDTGDIAGQLTQAETWLGDHPDDAQLLLCLGRLSAREKLWGKARDYFEKCYRQGHNPEICAELGRLLLALGEPRVAAAYYREGLELSQSELPDLPMPDATAAVKQR